LRLNAAAVGVSARLKSISPRSIIIAIVVLSGHHYFNASTKPSVLCSKFVPPPQYAAAPLGEAMRTGPNQMILEFPASGEPHPRTTQVTP
jgi:hypothetical protein